MSSSDEPRGPWEPWASAMIKAEAVDPRTMGNGKTPRPSWTRLARLAEVSTSTVTNTVFGRTTPSQQVVQAIAKALNELPDTVSEWLKLAAPVGGPWAPPQEAALLSHAEREALGDFIRAVTLGRREESDGHGNAAPTTTARRKHFSPPGIVIDQQDAATAAEQHAPQEQQDPPSRRS